MCQRAQAQAQATASPFVLQQPRPRGRLRGLGLHRVAELLSKARAGDCGLTTGRETLVEAWT